MVEFINNTSIDELNKIFDEITLIDRDHLPSIDELVRCDDILKELKISSTGGIKDWNTVLINAEGHPEIYKYGFKYMTNDKDFMQDHIFCTYSYLINLDRNLFVIKSSYGVALFDLNNIPSDWIYDAKIQMGIFEKDI